MLWITMSHAGVVRTPYEIPNYLMNIGYGGVDLCLFASGVGCYFSLTKDSDPFRFMCRRFKRLAPTYFCFILVWIVYKQIAEPMPLRAVLGNVLAIQEFTRQGYSFNWYISALFLFYFLTPFFVGVANRVEKTHRQAWVVLLLLLFSVPFWNTTALTIIVTRLPVFYIGIVFGKWCCRNKEFSKRVIVGAVVSAAAGIIVLYVCCKKCNHLLWTHGLHWYPFVLITPAMCLIISWVMQWFDRCKAGRAVVISLDKIGAYVFELYLIQVLLIHMKNYAVYTRGWLTETPRLWLVMVVLNVIGSIALRWIVNGITRHVPKRRVPEVKA